MNGIGVGLGRDIWILLFPGIVSLNPKLQKAFPRSNDLYTSDIHVKEGKK
jgi:hypothetical protein